MNKSHRSLWNESLGAWVAASELTCTRGKRGGARVVAAAIVAVAALGGLSGVASAAVIGAPVQAQDGVYSSGAASATGGDSTAVGAGSKASAQGTTAVGAASQASGGNATAVGIESAASGDQSLALGYKAKSSGLSSTAIGASAAAEGIQSIAVGASATVAAGATNAMAFGTLANAGAVGAIALGSRAVATAENSVALGAYSTTTANLAAAGYNAGASVLSGTASAANGEVSIGSAGKERRLTNLAAGSALTDAVNVSQLQSEAIKSNTTGASAAAAIGGGATYNTATGEISAPSYTVGGTTVNNVGSAITHLDGRVMTNTGDIADLKNGTAGLVQQDAGSRAITVAKGTDGTVVDFTGTAGARKLAGVADGAVDPTSKEAVNGAQLDATNRNVAANATAITHIDGRVTVNTNDIAALQNGTGGLVQQAAAGENITVAKGLDGKAVDFTGTAGERKLIGVADGAVDAASREAVNGSQLDATNRNVTANTSAISNIDGRVTVNTNDIAALKSGSGSLVQQAAAGANLTVGQSTDGAAVDFADQDGKTRTLKNVTEGVADQDAVNVSQLKATGLIDASGKALQAVAYDAGSNKGSITLGGANGTQIKNVADGTADQDAVNLGQLKKAGLVDGSGSTLDAVVYDAGSNRSKVTFGDLGAPPVLLSNVAAGVANTDAANVGQLRGVASALGGGAGIDANGNVIAPSYNVNNATYNNVQDALKGLAGTLGSGASIGDAKPNIVEKVTVETHTHLASSGDANRAAVATGDNAVALGAGATASANNSVALGAASQASPACWDPA